MCGRYSITTPVEALVRLFHFAGPLPNFPPRYNIAPTQQVPIVRRAPANGERDLAQVRWGLIPFWAKDTKIGYSLTNARADGIDTKPSFREAFKRGRRCLILADGYYEWEKKGTPKQPWRFTLKDGGPFAFAGLWERWEKSSDGVPVESCTIITTGANALAAKLHDRMPVILVPDDYPAWLGDNSATPPELLALLKPYPVEAMRAYPVSTAVNNVKNCGPECVEPVE
jgi:putative SOS response-associated peptidase YedK